MLLFRSEEHIERWCVRRGLPHGGTMTPGQAWQLARAWYVDKLDVGWRRKTVEEAEAVFAEIGLSGPFWSLR